MMDKELLRQSQSEQTSNGPAPSTPTTPTPPRLIPNPMLLDSPAPTLTPTTSSPPPPLTPAPSVSANHGGPKAVAAASGALSPHVLVPAPHKPPLTLRTYSRPILPSLKASAPTQTTSSSAVTAAAAPPSSVAHSNTTVSTKTSTSLTNGNPRPGSTPTPITPFHTPASPPGRQVSAAHPVGTPGSVQANQSPSPVRLLGKGFKGTGQDQVLLRAQMLILTSAMRPAQPSSSSSSSSAPPSNPASAQLQSLTLRRPPPGTLTIPPSLRLKPPSSAPPPLSRPNAPAFPPLRPRPQPGITATESLATPTRHLPVPPPTLYSPVRAVPLRPRLHSPNTQRAASPRQSSTLRPASAATPLQAPPTSRPLTRMKSCPLPQLGSAQLGPLPSPHQFERTPSAARQLQIIALSSGRQPKSVSRPAEDSPPPPLTSSSSAPPHCGPGSPLGQTGPPTQTLTQKGKPKDGSETTRDEGGSGKDVQVDKDVQRDKIETKRTEAKEEPDREEEEMDVTEEGERRKEEGETPMDQSETLPEQVHHQNQRPDTIKDSTEESKLNLGPTSSQTPRPAPVQASGPVQTKVPGPALIQTTGPVSVQTLVPGPVPVQRPVLEPVQVQTPIPGPVPVQTPVPGPRTVPEVSVQNQKVPEPHRDLQPVSQEDFCENMSTQSDNQSALSSLSSQSPPSSPFVTSSSEPPPPLLPPQTTRPTDLSLLRHEARKVDGTPPESRPSAETEPLCRSEDESESCGQSLGGPWEMKAWPEGRQVLTHLVEGFVIQEGLEPFPVNRSSLLVPEQVTRPQEVNGTNGRAAPPATEPVKPTEASTDSEDGGRGDADEPETRPAHKDRAVLHCQFCGKRGHAHNFMRSKRFCSTSCARGFNVRLTKRLRALSAGSRSERPRPSLNRAESVPGKPLLLRLPRDLWSAGRRDKEGKERVAAVEQREEEEELEGGGGEEDDDDGEEEEDPAVAMAARMERRATRRVRRASAPAVTSSAPATPTTTFRPAPSQWSVEEVTAFIHMLPGCGDVAEAFRLQEIDGQALLLLTEDHLMTSMNIKLGPALKICAHINTLKNP
ncbi:polyhomeotic-like protein 3 [Nematolebias whitei]|uniref:polyhomeotic-like protein 3 n=1 Tax=Nematolebias whitei TaxID=451745 RepID=UPI001897DDC2|nr:polyhomeotic-like protein 3 [Nematolebias whitei]